MGILPELGHTTSVGDGFPGSSKWFVLDPLTFLPDNEQVPGVCLEMGDAEEYVLCRIGRACLGKIARVSGSPKSSEPADENDDVKLTNV